MDMCIDMCTDMCTDMCMSAHTPECEAKCANRPSADDGALADDRCSRASRSDRLPSAGSETTVGHRRRHGPARIGHRRRHVPRAGTDMPVLALTASTEGFPMAP